MAILKQDIWRKIQSVLDKHPGQSVLPQAFRDSVPADRTADLVAELDAAEADGRLVTRPVEVIGKSYRYP